MSIEVKSFKLITGEEVITRFKKTDDGDYIFEKPRMVMLQPRQDGSFGMMLIPYMTSNPDGSFPIKTSSVVIGPSIVEKELENGYMQQTTKIAMV